MRHLCILICSVDDESPDHLTEVASYDLPTPDVHALHPETALDDLEATTQDIGHAVLRRSLEAQWDTIDATLADAYGQRFPP